MNSFTSPLFHLTYDRLFTIVHFIRIFNHIPECLQLFHFNYPSEWFSNWKKNIFAFLEENFILFLVNISSGMNKVLFILVMFVNTLFCAFVSIHDVTHTRIQLICNIDIDDSTLIPDIVLHKSNENEINENGFLSKMFATTCSNDGMRYGLCLQLWMWIIHSFQSDLCSLWSHSIGNSCEFSIWN